MSAPKFTPGPWSAEEMKRSIPGVSDEHANFIAAAPDMYEALRDLKREIQFLVEDGTLPISALSNAKVIAAEMALAKAEGK